jgi:hypothetical protein
MTVEEITYPLKVIKLVNGETIIARVNHVGKDPDEYLSLSDVMQIVSFDADHAVEDYGSATIALVRWNPFTDDKHITITVDKVISLSTVSGTFLRYYENAINKVKTEDHILDMDDIADEMHPEDAEEATKALKELTNAFAEMMKKSKRTLH